MGIGIAGGSVELVEYAGLLLPAFDASMIQFAQQGQQGLDGFLAHLLRQKTGLGGLLAALQQLHRPQIVLGLQQPQPGAMARALQTHGNQLPASKWIASART